MFLQKQQFQMSRANSNPSKSVPLIPNHQKKQSVFERLAYSLRKINKSCRLTLGCQHISKMSDDHGQKMINNLIHPYIKQVFTSKNIQQSKLRKKGKATFNVLNRIRSWNNFPSALEDKNLMKGNNPQLNKKQVHANCQFHSVSLNKNLIQKQQKKVVKPIIKQTLTKNKYISDIDKKRVKKIQNEVNRQEKQKKGHKNTGSRNQLTSNTQKNIKKKQKNKTDSYSTDHHINTDQKKSQINANISEINKQRMQTSIHIDNNSNPQNIKNQKQSQQLKAIPTSLSIQPNQNQHYLQSKSLGIHKIVEVTIVHHEPISKQQKQKQIETKVVEQNNQLSKELQKYKNQCMVLQDQLRQTLITVKHISTQLQAANKTHKQQHIPNNIQIKPTIQIQSQYQAQNANIIRVGFENNNNFTSISEKNQSKGISIITPTSVHNTYSPATIISPYSSYPYKITSQTNNPSSIQPLPNKNIVTESHPTNTHIIKTISPTVISTNSSKVIKLGRDRSYCTKGCTSVCDCLMTSAPLTYYPS